MACLRNYICIGLVICMLNLININSATGANCTVADDCKNGGSCNDQNNGTCTCVNGYSGDTCENAPESSAPVVHLSVIFIVSFLFWSFVMLP